VLIPWVLIFVILLPVHVIVVLAGRALIRLLLRICGVSVLLLVRLPLIRAGLILVMVLFMRAVIFLRVSSLSLFVRGVPAARTTL
jgi:hypothetical protein